MTLPLALPLVYALSTARDLQEDRGERIFLMVLEWCPLSLAALLAAAASSHASDLRCLYGADAYRHSSRGGGGGSIYGSGYDGGFFGGGGGGEGMETSYTTLHSSLGLGRRSPNSYGSAYSSASGFGGGGFGGSGYSVRSSQQRQQQRPSPPAMESTASWLAGALGFGKDGEGAGGLGGGVSASRRGDRSGGEGPVPPLSPELVLAVVRQLVNGVLLLHYKG